MCTVPSHTPEPAVMTGTPGVIDAVTPLVCAETIAIVAAINTIESRTDARVYRTIYLFIPFNWIDC